MSQYNAIERNLKPSSFDEDRRCSICGSNEFEFVGTMHYAPTLLINTYSSHDIKSAVGLTCADCFEPAMFEISLDKFLDVINTKTNLVSTLIKNNL